MDIASFNKQTLNDDIKKQKQIKINEFVSQAKPIAYEFVRELPLKAVVRSKYMFSIQVFFKVSNELYSNGMSKPTLMRINEMPRMLEIKFERGIPGPWGNFAWFDREWFRSNYKILNPLLGYYGIGDAGLKFYIDIRGYYYFAHVILRKSDGASINFYRGMINKETLAEIIATDYAKAHVGKSTFTLDDFNQALDEVLSQYVF